MLSSQSPVGTELNSAASLGSKKGKGKPFVGRDPLGRGAVDSELGTQCHTVSRRRAWEMGARVSPLPSGTGLAALVQTSRSPRRQGRASLSVGSESRHQGGRRVQEAVSIYQAALRQSDVRLWTRLHFPDVTALPSPVGTWHAFPNVYSQFSKRVES